MGRVTSISADDRRVEQVTTRDAATAVKELREAVTIAEETLGSVGAAFPSVVLLAAVVGGQVRGLFALTASKLGEHVSPIAADRLKALARLIGSLPTELRTPFEDELRAIPHADGPPVNFVTAEEIAADDEGRR